MRKLPENISPTKNYKIIDQLSQLYTILHLKMKRNGIIYNHRHSK